MGVRHALAVLSRWLRSPGRAAVLRDVEVRDDSVAHQDLASDARRCHCAVRPRRRRRALRDATTEAARAEESMIPSNGNDDHLSSATTASAMSNGNGNGNGGGGGGAKVFGNHGGTHGHVTVMTFASSSSSSEPQSEQSKGGLGRPNGGGGDAAVAPVFGGRLPPAHGGPLLFLRRFWTVLTRSLLNTSRRRPVVFITAAEHLLVGLLYGSNYSGASKTYNGYVSLTSGLFFAYICASVASGAKVVGSSRRELTVWRVRIWWLNH